MDPSKFKDWLEKKYGYTVRSRKDVVSRYNRTLGYLKSTEGLCLAEALKKLNSDLEFQGLSETVRSQLRKAVKLVYEYENRN